MIKRSLLIILLLTSLAYAGEQVTSYDESTIPVLNETIRKLSDGIAILNGTGSSTTQIAKTKYIYFVMPDDILAIGTDKLGRFYMPFAGIISDAHASVKTAPTGANLIVDINKNGTSLGATVTIAATANTGTQDGFTTTTFASGDYFTIDIDQVGSTIAGAKLVVRLKVVKT